MECIEQVANISSQLLFLVITCKNLGVCFDELEIIFHA